MFGRVRRKVKPGNRTVEVGRIGSEGFGCVEVGYARNDSGDVSHQSREIPFASLHSHLITDKKFEGIFDVGKKR